MALTPGQLADASTKMVQAYCMLDEARQELLNAGDPHASAAQSTIDAIWELAVALNPSWS